MCPVGLRTQELASNTFSDLFEVDLEVVVPSRQLGPSGDLFKEAAVQQIVINLLQIKLVHLQEITLVLVLEH